MRFKFKVGDNDFRKFLTEYNSAISDGLESVTTPSRGELVSCDEVVNKLKLDDFDW